MDINARLVGLLSIALVLAGLVAWALWERGERLSCEAGRVEITAAYTVLADKVKQRNAAVAQLEARAATAYQAGQRAAIKAEKDAEAAAPEIAALKTDIAATTPAGKTCVDAWALIQKGAP